MSNQFKLEQGREWAEIAQDADGNPYNLTAAGITDIKVEFIKPRTGELLIKDATITGTSLSYNGDTIPANTWVKVIFTGNDINEAGQWKSQLTFKINGYNAGSNMLKPAFTVVDSAYAYR